MKTKVLIFIDRLLIGGIQIFANNLINYIDKEKFEVDVLVLDDGQIYPLENTLKEQGIKVFKLQGVWIRKPQDLIKHSKKIKVFFKEHNDYDVVHVNSGPKNYAVLKYAKKYGVNVRIIHSHNTNFQSVSKAQKILGNILKTKVKKYATDFFACSDLASKWLFGENQKVTIIPNAINLDDFGYNNDVRSDMRKKLNVEDKVVIGNVGRFATQKNHSRLIDIFHEIQKNNENSVLLLVGTGELMNEVKTKTKTLGIEEKVKFLGFRDDTKKLFQVMDVFLMPSLYEGLPITGVEAQASGLPCVFSSTITRQAAILDETKYVSLEEKNEVWAKETLSLIGKVNREKSKAYLKNKGFDLPDMVQTIQNYYLK
ncbi:MAG: glycosyltransferase family 1 protein [Clostridia bacterium]